MRKVVKQTKPSDPKTFIVKFNCVEDRYNIIGEEGFSQAITWSFYKQIRRLIWFKLLNVLWANLSA